jgi:glycine/D-amino acid oxidase-like deaminating enzyme/nitrite reductase/ring-hydroxylating ferredoxin subunit
MSAEKIENSEGIISSGETVSYWLDSVQPLHFETLNADVDADVLIIGGGIAGLSTAYHMLKKGRSIVLVEDGYIASGETGRTTAHLTSALDDRYYEIENAFGEEESRKAAASHTAAIDVVEEIIRNENIDCDFRRINGYLFIHPSDTKENLKKEFDATQRAGLNTQWLEHIPDLSSENGPCICFPNQGQFHITKYLYGLANAIVKMGGRIYTQTHATKISEDGAICNGFKVTASSVVVATNTPVNDIVTMHTKQFPYRTYVIAGKVPKGSLSASLWWDTGDMHSKWITCPYHYVRLQSFDDNYDLLIAGGEDHKTGQADDEGIPEEERYARLTEWTKKRFPMMEEPLYKWSGQVMEPVDYMAFIGKNPGNDNIYIITGDSGNGMTHGSIAGVIISDLITGIENPWATIYAPKRTPLKTPKTYFSEVLNMAAQYGDYLKKGDIKDVDKLNPGEGAILSHGLKKIAVYKDEGNNVHAFSAVCPHLGCIVQWNGEERSFDCPCHGSRFTKDGVVINGPANSDLKRVGISE